MTNLNLNTKPQGIVHLIGAGTGDPDLITMKAVKIIQQCPVILIDDLVNPSILEYAPKDCKIIYVGKRGGCKSTPQAFINRLLVRYARQGYSVARLKGGDPFMFGRGGEEMLYLQQYGIEVNIISGITSGMAVPASLNIPVTHRQFTHGVSFLTGHDLNNYSWKSLVESNFTLVIYMGMKNLAEITQYLIQNGMSPTMPVAVIQNGTTDRSKAIVASLDHIYQETQCYGLGSPSIIIVGKVVTLADVSKLLNHQIDYICSESMIV